MLWATQELVGQIVKREAGSQTIEIRTEHSSAPTAQPLGCAILLVEDHSDTLRIMTRLLSSMGCTVHPAKTAEEAVTIADATKLDLVISDIGLPDATGFELMSQLQARHGLRGIALTGYAMEEDHEQSKQAGFEMHLTKPVDLKLLEASVRRLTMPS